jgi:predicted RND superfamily exporter protein
LGLYPSIMEDVEAAAGYHDTNYDLKSLIPDSEKLSEIFELMQKQFGHRLSKISLLVIKMSDVRSVSDSGCKWIIKENDSRVPEIASSLDSGCEGQTAEVLKYSTVLGEIEQKAANILRKRLDWLNCFVKKIDNQCAYLDKCYEELSDYTLKDKDNEEMQVILNQRETTVNLHRKSTTILLI